MANLIVTTARGGGYFVIDADRQVEVAFFQNQNIANDFAAQGVTTAAAIQLASVADVRASGGPEVAPAPLPVSTSPTIGNRVTYSTPDPAESPFAADRAARQALVGQSVPVTVVNDPLYEGGTRTEVVPVSQTQTAPVAVSNPPNPQVPPATPGAADVGEVPVSAIDRSPETPANDPQANTFVFDDNGELIPADSAQALDIIAQQTRVQNAVPGPVAGNFTISYNSESGLYDVVNLDNGDVVASNLTEQQAVLFAQDANTVGFDSAVIDTVNRNIDEDEATA